ncbi:hypothetical protein Lnau_2878 [Legionella nautarum]|uniref:Uncharacterized protein n=2 Tax=Legionella nautarum TaxID=45070 RepID=A0A0W0WLN4_9GAMM|nr:hypothetical protein Lnau_2878 [Legionella nautarum]
MDNNFITILLSPITLLFLINAFFLIFVTSFAWSIFLKIKYTNFLFYSFKTNNKPVLLLKIAFFFPIILIALFAEYQWSVLTSLRFFPLLSSTFVQYNAIGMVLSLIALVIIKNFNEEKAEEFKRPIFLMTYGIVLYLFYLIILIATVVTRLNAFPDGFLRSYAGKEIINQSILYALFLIYLMVVFFAVSMKTIQRVLLLLGYTIALAFAYSMAF